MTLSTKDVEARIHKVLTRYFEVIGMLSHKSHTWLAISLEKELDTLTLEFNELRREQKDLRFINRHQ